LFRPFVGFRFSLNCEHARSLLGETMTAKIGQKPFCGLSQSAHFIFCFALISGILVCAFL